MTNGQKKSFASFLPSGHFLYIFISLLIVVILVVVAINLSNKKKNTTGEEIGSISGQNKGPQSQDLANADITLADLKNWSNQEQTNEILSQIIKSTSTVNDPTTITGKLSQELLAQYLTAKTSGKTLSTAEKNSIIESVITKNYGQEKGIIFIAYTKSDLKIISEKLSDKIVSSYLDNLVLVFKGNTLKDKTDDLGIINTAFSTNDESSLNKLIPLIDYYKKISTDLKKTPVPEALLSFHLQMTNSLKRAGEELNNIRISFKDPLIAVISLRNYHQSLEDYKTALDALTNTLSGKKVQ